MAEESNDFGEDTQKGKFLTFGVDKEVYGIEICAVTEIISLQEITEIPEVPDYIKGIINLRGRIIPVMDIRLRFKKAFRVYNERTCVVIVEVRDLAIGLIVDEVAEVIFIDDQHIVSKPEMKSVQNNYIKNIGKVDEKIKLILDCEKLIHAEDKELLKNI